ncbi:calcium-binding protein [Jannaschia seohaensis]|uniref:calcium-binding protein n=1 Tax=Jannaschia seohaensis TaxID=475081 RepID=UPI001B87C41C|nr:calcium-binding protein [Jannaschia seohaensis]
MSFPLTFTLDAFGEEVENNFVDSAEGTSNGIPYRLVPQEGDLVFLPFSDPDPTQVFNDLPRAYEAIHTASNFTLTFDEPVQALLVATANDNATGDGYDFGLTPRDSIDIELDGTFMGSLDREGTLALLVADAPTETWVSLSEDDLGDGIDLAFFAFPDWPIPPTDGPDRLFGGPENDRLDGRAGDDTIEGRGGSDRLTGGRGDDLLLGGEGDDVLIAGGGTDTMEGGAQSDVFAFRPGEGPVTVRDFDPGEGDRLALDDRFFGLGDSDVDPRDVTQAQAQAALRAGRVEYDRGTGELMIDADGREGAEAPTLVAVLEDGPGFGFEDVLLF